jgi:hypothetical protein
MEKFLETIKKIWRISKGERKEHDGEDICASGENSLKHRIPEEVGVGLAPERQWRPLRPPAIFARDCM